MAQAKASTHAHGSMQSSNASLDSRFKEFAEAVLKFQSNPKTRWASYEDQGIRATLLQLVLEGMIKKTMVGAIRPADPQQSLKWLWELFMETSPSVSRLDGRERALQLHSMCMQHIMSRMLTRPRFFKRMVKAMRASPHWGPDALANQDTVWVELLLGYIDALPRIDEQKRQEAAENAPKAPDQSTWAQLGQQPRTGVDTSATQPSSGQSEPSTATDSQQAMSRQSSVSPPPVGTPLSPVKPIRQSTSPRPLKKSNGHKPAKHKKKRSSKTSSETSSLASFDFVEHSDAQPAPERPSVEGATRADTHDAHDAGQQQDPFASERSAEPEAASSQKKHHAAATAEGAQSVEGAVRLQPQPEDGAIEESQRPNCGGQPTAHDETMQVSTSTVVESEPEQADKNQDTIDAKAHEDGASVSTVQVAANPPSPPPPDEHSSAVTSDDTTHVSRQTDDAGGADSAQELTGAATRIRSDDGATRPSASSTEATSQHPDHPSDNDSVVNIADKETPDNSSSRTDEKELPEQSPSSPELQTNSDVLRDALQDNALSRTATAVTSPVDPPDPEQFSPTEDDHDSAAPKEAEPGADAVGYDHVWEVQRRHPFFFKFRASILTADDPPPWCTEQGGVMPHPDDIEPRPGWKYMSPWRVDTDVEHAGQNGWQYFRNLRSDRFVDKPLPFFFLRRRRWIRPRVPAGHPSATSSDDAEQRTDTSAGGPETGSETSSTGSASPAVPTRRIVPRGKQTGGRSLELFSKLGSLTGDLVDDVLLAPMHAISHLFQKRQAEENEASDDELLDEAMLTEEEVIAKTERLKSLLEKFYEPPCEDTLEEALDKQSWRCARALCPYTIPQFDPKSVLDYAAQCSFSGQAYCKDCMSKDPQVIPSRIIHYFDFTKHSVSREAAELLRVQRHQPLWTSQTIDSHMAIDESDVSPAQKDISGADEAGTTGTDETGTTGTDASNSRKDNIKKEVEMRLRFLEHLHHLESLRRELIDRHAAAQAERDVGSEKLEKVLGKRMYFLDMDMAWSTQDLIDIHDEVFLGGDSQSHLCTQLVSALEAVS